MQDEKVKKNTANRSSFNIGVVWSMLQGFFQKEEVQCQIPAQIFWLFHSVSSDFLNNINLYFTTSFVFHLFHYWTMWDLYLQETSLVESLFLNFFQYFIYISTFQNFFLVELS